jgi:divalent metal cation (Fe/Co/Zn/Cd) transporter
MGQVIYDDPDIIHAMHHASLLVRGIRGVAHTHARWSGHCLHGEAELEIDPALSIREGIELAERFRAEVMHIVPALAAFRVGIRGPEENAQ